MLMKFLFFLFLSFYSLLGEAGKTMGPVGNIIINSIFECDPKVSVTDVTVSANLKTIDDKGTKVLSAVLTNKIPIDESIMHHVELRKYESGSWRTIITQKGVLCKDLDKIFPKVYARIRSEVKPSVPTPCSIKPGKYVVTNFQATSKEVTIPTIFYGRFRLKVEALKNSKVITCLQAEFDSQAPN